MGNSKRNISSVFLGALLFVTWACSERTITNTVEENLTPKYKYSDDLSKYRPIVEVDKSTSQNDEVLANQPIESSYNIMAQFDTVLDTVALRNEKTATLKGFTILVYSGINERDAGRVRNRLYDILPEMQAVFEYKLPTYYVKVGRFYQIVEAQPLYEKIKIHYPNATVVPDQFKLKK
ncbi:MAG: hypothetical protein ACJAXX_000816 [Roseivirga sp.]|jgi:hypothetical protein